MEIVAEEHTVTVIDHDEGQKKVEHVDDPIEVPRRIMQKWNPKSVDDLPEDVFCGNEPTFDGFGQPHWIIE